MNASPDRAEDEEGAEESGTTAPALDLPDASDLTDAAPATTREASAATRPLESLTPRYVEELHGTYLRRLENAVKDPDNRNIALTGRYGAGKSSVLDKFERDHAKSTLRLAISTLAPGDQGETTTNRIEKEIVKQLLYGASENVGRSSRFSKIAVLSKRRAFSQSALLVGCVGTLLFLLGWLPDVVGTGPEHSTRVRVAAWAGAGLLATMLVTVIRLGMHGRFLSDVSAAGAGVSLTEKPQTFFDKYLDEIVHYFERESTDIVVFEDLDRFEDPYIFEALRELNVLLNDTPKRRAKRRGNHTGRAVSWLLSRFSKELPERLAEKLPDRVAARLLGQPVPLRFIYAIKDSVFEKLDNETAVKAARRPWAEGSESEPADTGGDEEDRSGTVDVRRRLDAAAAETVRANRTKFFDIVIPLVPFISHRNARDLLLGLLNTRGITGIDPRLINTVAQYCTDMRLMRNMCNEYLVFAERLLEPKEPNKPAPGMDATHLFALVAYKNFHLEDFENITRRDSDLDRLYGLHQQMVRDTIAACDARKRELLEKPGRVRTRDHEAKRLGARLSRHARTLLPRYGGNYASYQVGRSDWQEADISAYEFWASVAQHRSLTLLNPNRTQMDTFDEAGLEVFFPEGLDANRWADYDVKAVQAELKAIEDDVVELRRADFEDLANTPRFTLPPTVGPDRPEDVETFADLLQSTLGSDLARALVRRGFIDRNFSLYAAQFYGRFTGMDVANFMVQHVQPNVMAVDYDLSRPGAVENLLLEADEAGEELLHTVAGFNVDIVNYLLVEADPRIDDVIKIILADGPGDRGQAFLTAYFTSDTAQREKFAGRLAQHGWSEVFRFLVSDKVPANARPDVVSAALCAHDPNAAYEFGDLVREFIVKNYRKMPAFNSVHDAAGTDTTAGVAEQVAAAVDRADVVIPTLADVTDDGLRALIVGSNRYTLTAGNLRAALGVTGNVPLDAVQDNPAVYDYCLNEPVGYVTAVRDDSRTEPRARRTLLRPDALVRLLNDVAARWEEDADAEPAADNLTDLLAEAAPDAAVPLLRSVPTALWPAVVAAGLCRVSLANVEDYRAQESIDAPLARLLQRAGRVAVSEPGDRVDENGDEYDREQASVAILNASDVLAPELRVALAASLDPGTPLPVDDIDAEASDLFARLLQAKLVDDNLESFGHFRAGGWAAIGPAVAASESITTFVEPALVQGMVGNVLTDPVASNKLGQTIVEGVTRYVPEDDPEALRAVAEYADKHAVTLEPETVFRVARTNPDSGDQFAQMVVRLLASTSPAASADHIVAVFKHLGAPYDGIERTGDTFKVPYDDIHDRLLKTLRADDRISRGTARVPSRRYTVTPLRAI